MIYFFANCVCKKHEGSFPPQGSENEGFYYKMSREAQEKIKKHTRRGRRLDVPRCLVRSFCLGTSGRPCARYFTQKLPFIFVHIATCKESGTFGILKKNKVGGIYENQYREAAIADPFGVLLLENKAQQGTQAPLQAPPSQIKTDRNSKRNSVCFLFVICFPDRYIPFDP